MFYKIIKIYFLSSFQDKVILGTDYPFPLGELEPGKLIESMEEFDTETKVYAFYFMVFFLSFPALIVFGFRAFSYVITKNRELLHLIFLELLLDLQK